MQTLTQRLAKKLSNGDSSLFAYEKGCLAEQQTFRTVNTPKSCDSKTLTVFNLGHPMQMVAIPAMHHSHARPRFHANAQVGVIGFAAIVIIV
jgi:hypothetical protein